MDESQGGPWERNALRTKILTYVSVIGNSHDRGPDESIRRYRRQSLRSRARLRFIARYGELRMSLRKTDLLATSSASAADGRS